MGPSLPVVPALTVLIAALIAATTDVRQFKVHNRLTVPLLFSGLIYHGYFDGGQGVLDSALGALFGFALLIGFYLLGGMGAGDVKLMAAVGAWIGLKYTLYLFIASSLAAGIYALGILLVFGKLRETWINLQIIWHRVVAVGQHLGAEDRIETEIHRNDRRRRAIPFAAMMAAGFIAMIVWYMATSNSP